MKDILKPGAIRLRDPRKHLREDLNMLRRGILDYKGYVNGYRQFEDPVELRTTTLVTDNERVHKSLLVKDPAAFTEPYFDGKVWRDKAWDNRRRKYTSIRRQHNLRLNIGRDQQQRLVMFGDIGSGTGLTGAVITGSATAPTATTFTTATALPTAATTAGNTGLQGHQLFVANSLSAGAFSGGVFGNIVSNTGTVITVDQWYTIPVDGSVGTTPNANSAGVVLPGGTRTAWIALSTSTAAPAAADVPRTADGLWGDGTTGGAATETTTNGLARAYAGQGSATAPTYPAGGQYQFQHTWTYTGSTGVTLGKVILLNAAASVGNIPLLETLLSSTATVSTNGDTITVTWSITI